MTTTTKTNAMSTGKSAHKRQKIADGAVKKNAFDVMLESAKICWPSSPMPSFSIIQIVAENGWFPWNDNEEIRQCPDYSNLRLVCHAVKNFMDEPKCGGPDFNVIAAFLDSKHGFNDNKGLCAQCYFHDGDGCDTCTGFYESARCRCKDQHRYVEAFGRLDPRLNPEISFPQINLRQKSKFLVRSLTEIVDNFHHEYYSKWMGNLFTCWAWGGILSMEPNLTMIDPDVEYFRHHLFMNEFKEYNEPFYNFIHHLLFTGWAENASHSCPGAWSPYHCQFLQDNNSDGGRDRHENKLDKMMECFIRLHKSNDAESIPKNAGMWEPRYTLSQIQYIPETIRRCVMNSIDHKAQRLLGRPIADAIDLYRLVRLTFEHSGEELSQIHWQPCFGMAEEEYVPLRDFSGYNPQHERKNIDGTGLLWEKE
ncbi:hypothetical protein ACHAW6_014447 [Cyclotella cf. meneghiniana]